MRRRDFLSTSLVGAASLVEPAAAQRPVAPGRLVLREAVRLGARLRRGEISPLDWQDEIVAILSSCDLADLREAAAVRSVEHHVRRPRQGAFIARSPAFAALLADEGADVKLFFFEAGRADPPHVHFNLVAAHIVLEGEFRVRHFERIDEGPDGFVLRPTHDRRIGPGQTTTISDLRDNGHWHLAESAGVLLDVQQGRIDPTRPVRPREMIDIARAVPRPDGTYLVPRINAEEALRRYG